MGIGSVLHKASGWSLKDEFLLLHPYMRENSANSDKKMRPPNFFGGLECRMERSVLFLALEVDVREGVDDLDDAWAKR
jgi:hypothetical protein